MPLQGAGGESASRPLAVFDFHTAAGGSENLSWQGAIRRPHSTKYRLAKGKAQITPSNCSNCRFLVDYDTRATGPSGTCAIDGDRERSSKKARGHRTDLEDGAGVDGLAAFLHANPLA
jgi:hypothetical protein